MLCIKHIPLLKIVKKFATLFRSSKIKLKYLNCLAITLPFFYLSRLASTTISATFSKKKTISSQFPWFSQMYYVLHARYVLWKILFDALFVLFPAVHWRKKHHLFDHLYIRCVACKTTVNWEQSLTVDKIAYSQNYRYLFK